MAITSTIGESKTQEKEFPKLLKHTIYDVIVLANSNNTGVVIYSSDKDFVIGTIRNGLDLGKYKDYNEPLTLQNL
jgi:predicted nuclease of predicted toxin-antitoxin system